MNRRKNVQGFRPPRDTRNDSKRSLACEDPPRRFIFAQMTVGLKGCYERIRKNNVFDKNQATHQEEFLAIPESILAGRYKVIAKVGEGQSSLLVKAEDIFHPKRKNVAIKILHASHRNLGPQEASCLFHLKKADTLKVANIAHVLNTFAVGQHFCIVFEFHSPTPLYRYFKMFPFQSKIEKLKLIRRIAFQATQCLAVLSSLNIIHTDIKPENILFANGDKEDIKIIDFGNAIYWVHDEMSLYFGEFELQTMFYRAPEVWFGLPFGPQIDMWSLGCVLAELYLGEPLFLATSKDEILEKMEAMLGPFPMTPFQSGKYFSSFKKFVGHTSSVPGSSKNVVNVLKKLRSTDYVFADFLARLLVFDPGSRLTPAEAACHPFLASECAFGFMLPRGYFTQESGYSSTLLTPATYPHRPEIDEKIKNLHYSELDLLRFGTEASTIGKSDNVMKVLPFNYQEEASLESPEKACPTGNEIKTETRNQARKNGESIGKNATSKVFGVTTESVNASMCAVHTDRRYNHYNESCTVKGLANTVEDGDCRHKNMATSDEKTKVQSNEVKNSSQTKCTPSTSSENETLSTTNKNAAGKQTRNSPGEVNILNVNSSGIPVSLSPSTSTAGSGYHEDNEEIDNSSLVLILSNDKKSDFQEVASCSKHDEIASHGNATKSSNVQFFFDAFSDDETGPVSSSTKCAEVRKTTRRNSKSTMPAKTSRSKLFLGSKHHFAGEEQTTATCTKSMVTPKKKDDELLAENNTTSSNPLRNTNSSTGSEFASVTSSKKEDAPSAKSYKNRKRNKPEKVDGGVNETRVVTSSSDQGVSNNDSVSFATNKRKPRTPNLQKLKSVFETPSPCSAVTSTRELLPGGLSEIKNTFSRIKEERDCSQVPLVDSTRTSSNETQNPGKSEKYSSPRERAVKTCAGTNGKGGEILDHESKDSNIFSTGTGKRNASEEMDTSHPVDILTQEIVKQQPRKRKLDYDNLGLTEKNKSSLLDREAVKIQKTSLKKSKIRKYKGREMLGNQKESIKQTEEDVKRGFKDWKKNEKGKLGGERTGQCEDDDTEQNEEHRGIPCDGTSAFVSKSESSRKKCAEAKNGNMKRDNVKTTDFGNVSSCDDILRQDEQATVLDQSQSSEDDYEVLLL